MTAPTAVRRSRPHWLVFFSLAIAVVVIDQLSKAWLVGLLDPGESQSVIGDWLRIVHGRNNGAIFGLFRDQAVVFGLVSLVVIGLIVWYHRSSGRNLLMSIALGLLLGGAIGNMIDRLRLGYVVDWVDAGIGDLRFYTFNVADSAITGAVLLLLLIALVPALKAWGEDAPPDPAGDGEPDPAGDRETADA